MNRISDGLNVSTAGIAAFQPVSIHERLEELGYRHVTKSGWEQWWCPMHEQKGEHGPSFSVDVGKDGKDFVHCYGPCDQRELFKFILQGLRNDTIPVCQATMPPETRGGWGRGSYGNRISQWSIRNGRDTEGYFNWCWYASREDVPHETELYIYRNESGRPVAAKQKWSDKHYIQLRWRDTYGWQIGLNNITPPLYNSDVIAAKPEAVVWAVEGEKDADRLASAGVVVTSTHGPAAVNGRRSILAGRSVVVIPDNDSAGHSTAGTFALRATQAGAKEVRVLPPLGGDRGYDVSDFLDDGGTIGRLHELAAGVEPLGAVLVEEPRHTTERRERIFVDGATFILDAEDLASTLWGDVAAGMSLWSSGEGLGITGPQGVAKSTLAQQLALRRVGILHGELLGFPVKYDNRPVLYLALDPDLRNSAEDHR